MKRIIICLVLLLLLFIMTSNINNNKYKKNYSSRGFIIAKSNNGALISWRALKKDNNKISFKLFKNDKLLKEFNNKEPTDFFDKSYNEKDKYQLKIYSNNNLIEYIEPDIIFKNMRNGNNGAYFDIPLNIPKPVFMPNGEIATYSPNDVVAYDVDNDGMYEFIVKWDPSNSKDNSISGYTGNVYIDCYKLDGRKLWRIDMGKNIRAGASYTHMLLSAAKNKQTKTQQ